LDNNFAHLELSWEKTIVAIKFEVPTQKAAIASIEKALSGPSAGDYFSSAQYFYQSNGDLNKALIYVNKALELNADKPFWYNRQKSLILFTTKKRIHFPLWNSCLLPMKM
jgi:tetratricopeptide (TPR) repeat protein